MGSTFPPETPQSKRVTEIRRQIRQRMVERGRPSVDSREPHTCQKSPVRDDIHSDGSTSRLSSGNGPLSLVDHPESDDEEGSRPMEEGTEKHVTFDPRRGRVLSRSHGSMGKGGKKSVAEAYVQAEGAASPLSPTWMEGGSLSPCGSRSLTPEPRGAAREPRGAAYWVTQLGTLSHHRCGARLLWGIMLRWQLRHLAWGMRCLMAAKNEETYMDSMDAACQNQFEAARDLDHVTKSCACLWMLRVMGRWGALRKARALKVWEASIRDGKRAAECPNELQVENLCIKGRCKQLRKLVVRRRASTLRNALVCWRLRSMELGRASLGSALRAHEREMEAMRADFIKPKLRAGAAIISGVVNNRLRPPRLLLLGSAFMHWVREALLAGNGTAERQERLTVRLHTALQEAKERKWTAQLVTSRLEREEKHRVEAEAKVDELSHQLLQSLQAQQELQREADLTKQMLEERQQEAAQEVYGEAHLDPALLSLNQALKAVFTRFSTQAGGMVTDDWVNLAHEAKLLGPSIGPAEIKGACWAAHSNVISGYGEFINCLCSLVTQCFGEIGLQRVLIQHILPLTIAERAGVHSQDHRRASSLSNSSIIWPHTLGTPSEELLQERRGSSFAMRMEHELSALESAVEQGSVVGNKEYGSGFIGGVVAPNRFFDVSSNSRGLDVGIGQDKGLEKAETESQWDEWAWQVNEGRARTVFEECTDQLKKLHSHFAVRRSPGSQSGGTRWGASGELLVLDSDGFMRMCREVQLAPQQLAADTAMKAFIFSANHPSCLVRMPPLKNPRKRKHKTITVLSIEGLTVCFGLCALIRYRRSDWTVREKILTLMSKLDPPHRFLHCAAPTYLGVAAEDLLWGLLQRYSSRQKGPFCLTGSNFAKCCRELNLVGGRVSHAQVDIIFDNVVKASSKAKATRSSRGQQARGRGLCMWLEDLAAALDEIARLR
ncbi:unnamed protein product [Chrysoparadoxa australica]